MKTQVPPEKLPVEIRKKMYDLHMNVRKLAEKAMSFQVTTIDKGFYFRLQQKANSKILSDYERAVSLSFVTRYDHLPIPSELCFVEDNGNYCIENLGHFRHVINEYRSIIFNKKDSIYYNKIHSFCRYKLLNNDPTLGLSISVYDENDNDITSSFIKILDERNKSIRYLIENSDYDYLYNGILQHTAPRFTEQYWDDYTSGRINYIFIAHSHYLGFIKDFLKWHYTIINQLTFPELGPL